MNWSHLHKNIAFKSKVCKSPQGLKGTLANFLATKYSLKLPNVNVTHVM